MEMNCRNPQACPLSPPFARPITSISSHPNLPILLTLILGILAVVSFVIAYYSIVSRCCRSAEPFASTVTEMKGLEQSVIKSIPVIRLQDVLVDKSIRDCAVCLNDFSHQDCLRMLPKCSHIFHVQCIDSWLSAHMTCPLCRANVLVSLDSSSPSESHLIRVLEEDGNPDRGNGVENGRVMESNGLALCHGRALSDLVDRCRILKGAIQKQLAEEEECCSVRVLRRSYSVDSYLYRHFIVDSVDENSRNVGRRDLDV